MKFILQVRFPVDRGNEGIRDPQFGAKMRSILTEMKAEAAYFTTIDGQRGGYIIVNMDDASQMPAIAEPFFLWMNADVKFLPVMQPQDLEKAGPAIGSAVKKW